MSNDLQIRWIAKSEKSLNENVGPGKKQLKNKRWLQYNIYRQAEEEETCLYPQKWSEIHRKRQF